MIKVFLQKESKVIFRHKRLFKKIASVTMKELSINGRSEVNVIITNNEGIRKISKEYKKKDKATDVLSFPGDWKQLAPMIGYNMLGDIYISFEKVISQSIEYGHSSKREWAYLFTHGLLHCCGYDHINKKDEDEMNGIASKIMKIVKVGRNG